jgi:hypothetical protein
VKRLKANVNKAEALALKKVSIRKNRTKIVMKKEPLGKKMHSHLYTSEWYLSIVKKQWSRTKRLEVVRCPCSLGDIQS